MKRLAIVVAIFVVVVLGGKLGTTWLAKKAENPAVSPVGITGSFSGEKPEAAVREVPSGDSRYRTIEWDDLMPPGWNPVKSTEGLNIDELQDNDPRAIEALKKTVAAWKDAPLNPALDNSAIRIGGFVVSLEHEGAALREFLLVPYYGACIHTPPPPPNQIIHVILQKPVRGIRSLDAVWVTGEMTVGRTDTREGTSGYTIRDGSALLYKPDSKP